ncbi:hypothetical protein J0J21_22880, partial [Vibrio vulnificus]|uniref:hypothetical protein n=1 Tax=Vibrio vulnificus TaxID=672 RepID=UPI0019D46F97
FSLQRIQNLFGPIPEVSQDLQYIHVKILIESKIGKYIYQFQTLDAKTESIRAALLTWIYIGI